MIKEIAPLLVFVYSRPSHTRRTFEALSENYLTEQTDLIIFSDGSKNTDDKLRVSQVRSYLKTISGFKSIKVIERENNIGLAENILSGVDQAFRDYDSVIVLEDDMETSSFFLRYMNDALNLYKSESRVASIHGYIYPTKENMHLPKTFFLKGADCWGWATWKDRWEDFERNPYVLKDHLNIHGLKNEFNYDNSYPYFEMLEGVIEGRNNSWAILWHASNYIKNKFTLYSNKSFVRNIGNDNSGTHSDSDPSFDTELINNYSSLGKIEISESALAKEAFRDFFQIRNRRPLRKILSFIRNFIKNLLST